MFLREYCYLRDAYPINDLGCMDVKKHVDDVAFDRYKLQKKREPLHQQYVGRYAKWSTDEILRHVRSYPCYDPLKGRVVEP